MRDFLTTELSEFSTDWLREIIKQGSVRYRTSHTSGTAYKKLLELGYIRSTVVRNTRFIVPTSAGRKYIDSLPPQPSTTTSQ